MGSTFSGPFVIKQSDRQGGGLTTAHFKRCNNPLLIKLENNFTGGGGHDWVHSHFPCHCSRLMSHSPKEMQMMVPTCVGFANRIHPKESCILITGTITRHEPSQTRHPSGYSQSRTTRLISPRMSLLGEELPTPSWELDFIMGMV